MLNKGYLVLRDRRRRFGFAWSAVATCLALLLFAAPLGAYDGADPALNAPYRNPDFGAWVERFESEGREVYDRRAQIVAATQVKPGMVVADVGAGTGLFTRLFAAAVGSQGRVYAVDISPGFVDNIQRRAREDGMSNVIGIVSTQDDTLLPANTVDIAFVCDTYHHFEHPRSMLRSMRRALQPDGTLVVIDFERIEGQSSAWVMGHVRAGRPQVIREIESEGFALIEQPALLKQNFFLRFRKRSGADSRPTH